MKGRIFSALLMTAVFGSQTASAAESTDAIRLNQIGFFPEALKA